MRYLGYITDYLEDPKQHAELIEIAKKNYAEHIQEGEVVTLKYSKIQLCIANTPHICWDVYAG